MPGLFPFFHQPLRPGLVWSGRTWSGRTGWIRAMSELSQIGDWGLTGVQGVVIMAFGVADRPPENTLTGRRRAFNPRCRRDSGRHFNRPRGDIDRGFAPAPGRNLYARDASPSAPTVHQTICLRPHLHQQGRGEESPRIGWTGRYGVRPFGWVRVPGRWHPLAVVLYLHRGAGQDSDGRSVRDVLGELEFKPRRWVVVVAGKPVRHYQKSLHPENMKAD